MYGGMGLLKLKILPKLQRWAAMCVIGAILFAPAGALAADASLVDALNLAPFIPLVLDALMAVATGGYEFFVGNGDGVIYILVWGFWQYHWDYI